MTTWTPLLTRSVEQASEQLLNHFQSQYGSLIFLPLGVNSKTPGKIAPNIAENLEQAMLQFEDGKVTMMVTDEKVAQVFDSFITNFFNSLSFIAKRVMKTLGMKMMWNDFAHQLKENKQKNLAMYEKWKANLTMVLNGVFSQVVDTLKTEGQEVILTNGEQFFDSVEPAIDSLVIFE